MNISLTIRNTIRLAVLLAAFCSTAIPAARAQVGSGGYYVRFPDDKIVLSCDPDSAAAAYSEPIIFDAGADPLIGMSYEDLIFFDVPDACIRIQRTWRIINWLTFDPELGFTEVPNPTPSPISNHPLNLAGPVVSAAGTLPPWAPASVKVNPGDSGPTDYSTFWSETVNQFVYTQYIRFIGSGYTVVAGVVTLDANADCQSGAAEPGIPQVLVKATDSQGNVGYGGLRPDGSYEIIGLLPGNVDLEAEIDAPFWNLCDANAQVNLATATSYASHNFSAQATSDCPLLNIRLATALLRPCGQSEWKVDYCNLGAGTAENARIELDIPDGMSFVSATLPATLNGNTLTIPLGDVPAGGCDRIRVTMQVACDAEVVGARMCVDARIFPNTLCVPEGSDWAGAQIELEASCDGDAVRFTLRNTGSAPTSSALDYVIIDDMVIMKQGQLPAGFAPGAELEETADAAGATLRLKSKQEPSHPLYEEPSLAVDNCNGTALSSAMLDFANADGSPFSTLACREVVASYDPNEILAFPRGFSDQHLLEPTTPLRYQINFQNTGNDTAFLVVLRDTLPVGLLDPATFRPVIASHDYSWQLSEAGVLSVTFANILLVDSTTNEPASHGFFVYDIAQKPNNPLGSVIENRAGIYFDINPVVLTNTAWHTLAVDFPQTSGTPEPSQTADALKIWPNPAAESAFVALQNPTRIRLLDPTGRLIRQFDAQAPGLRIDRAGLPDGAYWIEARDRQTGTLRTGRLLWR